MVKYHSRHRATTCGDILTGMVKKKAKLFRGFFSLKARDGEKTSCWLDETFDIYNDIEIDSFHW